jgi:hypothetical protein
MAELMGESAQPRRKLPRAIAVSNLLYVSRRLGFASQDGSRAHSTVTHIHTTVLSEHIRAQYRNTAAQQAP